MNHKAKMQNETMSIHAQSAAKDLSRIENKLQKSISEIDGHCSTQILACTNEITNNYNETVKDLQKF